MSEVQHWPGYTRSVYGPYRKLGQGYGWKVSIVIGVLFGIGLLVGLLQ